MDHDEFIGEVQHRAQLSSRGEALQATRAVLETLSERIQEGQAENLAAQLPEPLEPYLTEVEGAESFDFQEFIDRVAERDENINAESDDDLADSAYHARVVVDVIQDAVTEGQLEDIKDGLPEDYGDLFELAEADVEPPDPEEQQ